MTRQRRNRCREVEDKVLDVDRFGQSFQFKLPNGKDVYTSWLGFGCTLILYLILISYGIFKAKILIKFGDSTIIQSVQDSYFTDEKVHGQDDGFQLAFGITAYDGNPEPIDDPTYGRIVARYETWGLEGSPGLSEIPIKQCSYEDLGLDDGRAST